MKYNFVGYGSLMSHKSLEKTVENKHFKPVIVKGYKRVFNIIEAGDVLNLKKNKNSRFNGVLFRVNEKELKKIRRREKGYSLEQTWAYNFLNGKKLCKCFIVIDHLFFIDKRRRKPNKGYFVLCREAAYHISKKFGEYWDNTTYISTGEKVSSWIKRNKEYNTINT